MNPASWSIRLMTVDDIEPVVAFEREACRHTSFAWSEENYRSSLASGYWMRVCCEPDGRLMAVCVAMFGVDELHLLNIAVARPWHGQGVAPALLALLVGLCRAHRLSAIWLEVRPSNDRARALYGRHGYLEAGVRRHYYPAPDGREDAIVMKREVSLDGPMD